MNIKPEQLYTYKAPYPVRRVQTTSLSRIIQKIRMQENNAQACGNGRACLEDAIAYANEYLQFGKPISGNER
jgi:hypothetical protein